MNLRWYQSEAVSAVWSHLCNRQDNPVCVLPTGSGKSHVIAQLCKDAIENWAGRILVVAHRKELLRQNAAKLDPGIDRGLYSAGLRREDINQPVIFCGIQSVHSKSHEFGRRHLVIVDEAHLVGQKRETMYSRFLTELKEINPDLRVVGLTATPFRMDVGPLCRPDAIFNKVCYTAPMQQLIAEGFLANLTSKPADNTSDTSGIEKRGGEFAGYAAEQFFDQPEKIDKAVFEILEKTRDRKSTLVFCSGVDHAEHVAEKLGAAVVTGETLPLERQRTIERFQRGEIKYLCNCDVLTTGFDAPNIDCVAILRATMSAGLFCQMVGRGLRIHPGKNDCLVLDFGENLTRHGPIDAVDFGRPRDAGNGKKPSDEDTPIGEAPTKVCPGCDLEVLASTKVCECGLQFWDARHNTQADESSQILAEPIRWIVEAVEMEIHVKQSNGSRTLRVDYNCRKEDGAATIDDSEWVHEWVCLEHTGYAERKAAAWWAQHSNAEGEYSTIPGIEEAIDLFNRGAVRTPVNITTIVDNGFTRVIAREFDEELPETWSDEAVLEEEEIPF